MFPALASGSSQCQSQCNSGSSAIVPSSPCSPCLHTPAVLPHQLPQKPPLPFLWPDSSSSSSNNSSGSGTAMVCKSKARHFPPVLNGEKHCALNLSKYGTRIILPSHPRNRQMVHNNKWLVVIASRHFWGFIIFKELYGHYQIMWKLSISPIPKNVLHECTHLSGPIDSSDKAGRRAMVGQIYGMCWVWVKLNGIFYTWFLITYNDIFFKPRCLNEANWHVQAAMAVT